LTATELLQLVLKTAHELYHPPLQPPSVFSLCHDGDDDDGDIDDDGEKLFPVTTIERHKVVDGDQLLYLTKWRGGVKTWEPPSSFDEGFLVPEYWRGMYDALCKTRRAKARRRREQETCAGDGGGGGGIGDGSGGGGGGSGGGGGGDDDNNDDGDDGGSVIDGIFEVERVDDDMDVAGVPHYLTKWKDYEELEWVAEENLEGSVEIIGNYWKTKYMEMKDKPTVR